MNVRIKPHKYISAFFIFATIILPLNAVDWGGFISNDTGIKGKADTGIVKDFMQSNKLTLWLRTPLPNLKGSYFIAEGFYNFKYTNETKKHTHILDLNLFKLSLAANHENTKIMFNIGRYGIADISGFIFSQNADGMEIRADAARTALKFYVGYTGFLNGNTAGMNLPETDDTDRPYRQAPHALIGSASLRFPQLFKQQTLSCEISGSTFSSGNAVFAALSLHGPLSGSVFYLGSSVFALRRINADPPLFSNLSNFELTAYFPFMSSSASWNTVFATGKTGEKIGDFQSFSVIPASLGGSIKYAGHIKTGLTGSIKPAESLLCTLNTDIFFNVMNSAAPKGFAGAQWQSSIRWQLLSDLQLALSCGQFFTARRTAITLSPYTMASIRVLYSF